MTPILNDYQKWTDSTAIYRQNIDQMHWLNYCILGLNEETGELLKVRSEVANYKPSNSIFDTIDPAVKFASVMTKAENFIKEAGDVMWYVSQIGNLLGVCLSDCFEKFTETDKALRVAKEDIIEVVLLAGQIAGYQKKSLRDKTDFRDKFILAIGGIINRLHAILGWDDGSFELIIQANMDKLSDRKDRGVLQGSGDNR